MHECESLIEFQAVSISETESWWVLIAKWICPQFERDCLRGIMLKHSVLISELDDYTVFC
jgi:hypothetical protein